MRRPRFEDPVPALKQRLAAEVVACVESPTGIGSRPHFVLGGPALSNLRLGRLDRYSVQGLMRLLVKLGYEVCVTVTPPGEVIRRQYRHRRLALDARRPLRVPHPNGIPCG